MVETDFSLVRFRGDTERAAKVYKGVKPLTAEDVAEVIVWAAEPARPRQHRARAAHTRPAGQLDPVSPQRVVARPQSGTARTNSSALDLSLDLLQRSFKRSPARWVRGPLRENVLSLQAQCLFLASLVARCVRLPFVLPHSSRSPLGAAPDELSAFAICSSTDLLSHPRAISSFYGRRACLRLTSPAATQLCRSLRETCPCASGKFPLSALILLSLSSGPRRSRAPVRCSLKFVRYPSISAIC